MDISEKDLEILRELQKDSSGGLKKLSRKLKMPVTTVYDRKKKMEKNGIIKKYKAVLDPDKVNKPIVAFILLRINSNTPLKQAGKELAKISGVMEVHVITGEWDILLKVRAKDIKEIGNFVTDKLSKVKCIQRTLTINAWIALKDESDILI